MSDKSYPRQVELWTGLRDRLIKAERNLEDLELRERPYSNERSRLTGKCSGVSLARSYVEEIIRDLPPIEGNECSGECA